ncbi:hypothetical protein QNO09_37645 [Streptomyces sp. 378]|uniref:hypothetical protein n=1 Tax=Streptomyces sp. 378 TaxID=3049412 RepID=UPI0024C24DD0|nr:hypothetical protein [Streptomyces sp. 378]MDK1348882.1 hypothetical protein [Streptomyces sp. 378]
MIDAGGHARCSPATTPMRAIGRHIPLRRACLPDEASYFTGASLDGDWATVLPGSSVDPRPASG